MSASPRRGLAIRSLGVAVPPHAMSQSEAHALACRLHGDDPERASLLRALYRRSGVEQRFTVVPHRQALDWLPEQLTDEPAPSIGPTTAERMAVYRQQAPLLACQAAEAALQRTPIAASEVSHLITVSCTGFDAPGIDVALIRQLGLPSTVERTHIGFMGCHGALNALRVAKAFVQAQPEAVVLLCAVELCSLHYHFAWDPERLVGNAIFGDGAAALIGTAAVEDNAWHVAATGSCLLPDSEQAIRWTIGDRGFEMSLSARVPDLIRQHLRPWLAGWLDRCGLAIGDVGSWAIHPGGPRVVSAVEAALELPAGVSEASRDVLRRYGNMSSPTVLFILQELMSHQAARPCVLLGFGPGMTAEAVLVR